MRRDEFLVSRVRAGLLRRQPFAARDARPLDGHQRGFGDQGPLALQGIAGASLAALGEVLRVRDSARRSAPGR